MWDKAAISLGRDRPLATVIVHTAKLLRDLGIGKQATVEFRDYRDLSNDAAFDKVSSSGIFEHVSQAAYRVWRLYMAACALLFERGAIGVYQILAVNRREGFIDLPLTRHDIYR